MKFIFFRFSETFFYNDKLGLPETEKNKNIITWTAVDRVVRTLMGKQKWKMQ